MYLRAHGNGIALAIASLTNSGDVLNAFDVHVHSAPLFHIIAAAMQKTSLLGPVLPVNNTMRVRQIIRQP